MIKQLMFVLAMLCVASSAFAAGPAFGHRNCTGTAAAIGSNTDRMWLASMNSDTSEDANSVCYTASASGVAADATAACLKPGVGFVVDNGPESINGIVAAQPVYCVTSGATVRIDFMEGHK